MQKKVTIYSPTVRADFDFPRRIRGSVSQHNLMFATLPRCGSHFICQKFFSTGRAGLPLEYFNPAHWMRWRIRIAAEAAGQSAPRAGLLGEASVANTEMPRASDRHTLHALFDRRTGPNGCFSAKLHYTNLDQLKSLVSESWISNANWVRIERRDLVAQVVSWEIAVQTGSWIYTQKVWRQPIYQFDALIHRLAQLLQHRDAWSLFFSERNINPKIIYYEEFVTNPNSEIDVILQHFGLLGTEHPSDTEIPHIPNIQSQFKAINAEWAERFCQDLRGYTYVVPQPT